MANKLLNEKALLETHQPQILTGFSPFTGLPSFYGLGWSVSYYEQARLRLNHSGAFALGAATHVNLVPAEHLGVVILTNAYPSASRKHWGRRFRKQLYTESRHRTGLPFTNNYSQTQPQLA